MPLEVITVSRKRRKFTPEFKRETVKLVKEGPRSSGQVARDLDLTESAVRNWVRQYEVDTGVREGLSSAEREELGRLRAENRQLRMERDILKNFPWAACGPTCSRTNSFRARLGP